MHSAGSGAFKMRVYQPHQAIVLEANESAPAARRSSKASSLKTSPIRLHAAC
jgi:peptide/nickel transport system substrate-binding protein